MGPVEHTTCSGYYRSMHEYMQLPTKTHTQEWLKTARNLWDAESSNSNEPKNALPIRQLCT